MTLLEKISKISQTNKIPKRQHKEKNSQSNNRYSEPKKKKENLQKLLTNEIQNDILKLQLREIA